MNGSSPPRFVACALVAFALAACGGQAPASAPPAQTPATAGGRTAPEKSIPALEYVVVKTRWVERYVPAAQGDVRTWAEAPENANAALLFRHILIRAPESATPAQVATAKKQAEAALARVNKGEDFAKVMRQVSEDPGGSEYPASAVENFVAPVKESWNALAPGGVSSQVVKSSFGFHIVQKARASDEQLERAYRKAKAPETTKLLAAEIGAGAARGGALREVVADAVEKLLGESAKADADRPSPVLALEDRLQTTRLAPEAKAALETFAKNGKPGEVLHDPIVTRDAAITARIARPQTGP